MNSHGDHENDASDITFPEITQEYIVSTFFKSMVKRAIHRAGDTANQDDQASSACYVDDAGNRTLVFYARESDKADAPVYARITTRTPVTQGMTTDGTTYRNEQDFYIAPRNSATVSAGDVAFVQTEMDSTDTGQTTRTKVPARLSQIQALNTLIEDSAPVESFSAGS